MIRIPVFFHEIYSEIFIKYIQNIHNEVTEIKIILPKHCIIEQFESIFFQMTKSLQPMLDEEIIEEYYLGIQEFSNFLKKFKELENEIKLFIQKKKVRRRVRNYYYDLFLKKKDIIFSNTYQTMIDLTLNSLMGKEMDQEIFYLRQHNYSSKKLQPTLPILIEN